MEEVTADWVREVGTADWVMEVAGGEVGMAVATGGEVVMAVATGEEVVMPVVTTAVKASRRSSRPPRPRMVASVA